MRREELWLLAGCGVRDSVLAAAAEEETKTKALQFKAAKMRNEVTKAEERKKATPDENGEPKR